MDTLEGGTFHENETVIGPVLRERKQRGPAIHQAGQSSALEDSTNVRITIKGYFGAKMAQAGQPLKYIVKHGDEEAAFSVFGAHYNKRSDTTDIILKPIQKPNEATDEEKEDDKSKPETKKDV
jgi:hypothetical protein